MYETHLLARLICTAWKGWTASDFPSTAEEAGKGQLFVSIGGGNFPVVREGAEPNAQAWGARGWGPPV